MSREVSKVKNLTREEVENATTIDIEKLLNPTGKEAYKIMPGGMESDAVEVHQILNNLPDMLLCAYEKLY